MSATDTNSFENSFSVIGILALFVGMVVTGYGILLVPQSALGGAHIVAVGLSLVLSGLFATEWVGSRLGLSAVKRRKLSLGFAVVGILLLVLFVVLNFASFEAAESESSG